MKRRGIINFESDKNLSKNKAFIEACYDFIFRQVDNMNSSNFKYYEKDSENKACDALYYMQISDNYNDLFNDSEFLKRYEKYIDWNLVSCDKRISWDETKLNLCKDKVIFGTVCEEYLYHSEYDFIQRCTRQSPSACGLSLSPSLTPELILKYQDLWDWEILANNPIILKCDIYSPELFGKLIKEILFSANPGLTFEHLSKIREIYNALKFQSSVDVNGIKGKTIFKEKEIYWAFSWQEAFTYSNVNWNLAKVNVFLDVLNNQSQTYSQSENFSKYCWSGLSHKLTDKSTILVYNEKLNYYNLSNNNLIWDKELLTVLIKNMFDKEFEVMDGYYGDRVKGLPYILENIKITNDVIIANRDFWNKKYYYERYRRNSDGSELILSEHKFIDNLKSNKEVTIPNEIKTTGNNV